jgi:hypothetical protein
MPEPMAERPELPDRIYTIADAVQAATHFWGVTRALVDESTRAPGCATVIVFVEPGTPASLRALLDAVFRERGMVGIEWRFVIENDVGQVVRGGPYR